MTVAMTDDAKQWVDYYGEFAHDDHHCPDLGKTRWREVTDRPDCPRCCDIPWWHRFAPPREVLVRAGLIVLTAPVLEARLLACLLFGDAEAAMEQFEAWADDPLAVV